VPVVVAVEEHAAVFGETQTPLFTESPVMFASGIEVGCDCGRSDTRELLREEEVIPQGDTLIVSLGYWDWGIPSEARECPSCLSEYGALREGRTCEEKNK
jgi:hypothetical protein